MDATTGARSGDSLEAADFAQRILQIINEGDLTSTYKLALLLSLMDACMERTAVAARQPIEVHRLDSKMVDLYWQQTLPYPGLGQVPTDNGNS
jgi:hypothetical protein